MPNMPATLARSVAAVQQPVASLMCVAPDRVNVVWPHVLGFFLAAYDRGIGDDNVEFLKADVDAGRQRIWIVWDGHGIIAAAATKLVDMPAKRLCIITACGGGQLSKWAGFKASFEDYARAEGCDAIRLMGRRGWQDVFSDYYQPWICLQKDLKE